MAFVIWVARGSTKLIEAQKMNGFECVENNQSHLEVSERAVVIAQALQKRCVDFTAQKASHSSNACS